MRFHPILRTDGNRAPYYGSAAGGPCVGRDSAAQVERLASAGRAALNYEVRIVDEEGRDVPVGQVGEIAVRSEAMTIGYWDLP